MVAPSVAQKSDTFVFDPVKDDAAVMVGVATFTQTRVRLAVTTAESKNWSPNALALTTVDSSIVN